MKIIKYGKLYGLYIDCPHLDCFFLVRLFRKLGLNYIPLTLRSYDRIFMREAKSRYARLVADYCKRHGIQVYVVQEGGNFAKNPAGHLPFYGDYFLCPPDQIDWWVSQGMTRGIIRPYIPQKESRDYKGIVFLSPFYTWDDFHHPYYWQFKNRIVAGVIDKFMQEDVVFKPHPKNADITRRFIPPHRIVRGEATALIRNYDKIYCFSDSTIRKDCELVGKPYTMVDKE